MFRLKVKEKVFFLTWSDGTDEAEREKADRRLEWFLTSGRSETMSCMVMRNQPRWH